MDLYQRVLPTIVQEGPPTSDVPFPAQVGQILFDTSDEPGVWMCDSVEDGIPHFFQTWGGSSESYESTSIDGVTGILSQGDVDFSVVGNLSLSSSDVGENRRLVVGKASFEIDDETGDGPNEIVLDTQAVLSQIEGFGDWFTPPGIKGLWQGSFSDSPVFGLLMNPEVTGTVTVSLCDIAGEPILTELASGDNFVFSFSWLIELD